MVRIRCTNSVTGFTLIEVVIALAIIAIGMAAVMTAVTTNIANAAGLKERTIAHWVAMNKIAEYQIEESWPTSRRSNDSAEMAGSQWYIHTLVSDLKMSGLKEFGIVDTSKYKQVDVQVRLDENSEYPIVTLTSYIVK